MKRMNMILIFSLLTLFSCGSKIDTAKDSLLGSWQVTEVFMSVPSTGLTMEDKSGIGSFEFTESTCDYNFTFNSESEINSFEYKFEHSKENSGFTNVDRFDIVGDENYRVRFGDQTSDSYENATEIQLERSVVSDSVSFEYFISLEKI